ncbi:MAG: flagellar biosynthesis protein FlhB [Rhodobacteraceae bacterium]|nr:flagellar biosynthesis protein FlhB [Paracoccaceae bacterium]
MAGSEDNDDKQHEPTQKKLDDARRKGEIPRSTDLTTAAAYGGLLIVAISVGGTSLEKIGALFAGLISRAEEAPHMVFSGSGAPFFAAVTRDLMSGIFPWFFIPGLTALLAILAQRGFVVAPEKLKLKLSRISPLSNAKNKFGRSGLFEFFKSFVKLNTYSVVLGVFLWRQLPVIIETISLNPPLIPVVLFQLCISFFVIVLLISLSIGGIDFLWQHQEHMRKNRMSHKELTDEVKQSEGDPHVKQQRRQKGYDIAMNQMLADVPDADVVVVNPTHFAVALKWNRMPGAAPVCVAKGVDEIAARIREVAAQSGVPIHHDPPTARAIHAVVDIGHEISADHYQAVAAAIRFAEEMRKRARQSQVGHKT